MMEQKRKRLLPNQRKKDKKRKKNKNHSSLTSSVYLINKIGTVSPKLSELSWKNNPSYC
jgi:hypothetical protein